MKLRKVRSFRGTNTRGPRIAMAVLHIFCAFYLWPPYGVWEKKKTTYLPAALAKKKKSTAARNMTRNPPCAVPLFYLRHLESSGTRSLVFSTVTQDLHYEAGRKLEGSINEFGVAARVATRPPTCTNAANEKTDSDGSFHLSSCPWRQPRTK